LTAAGDRRPGTIDIWVATKSDLLRSDPNRNAHARLPEASVDWIECSALTGEGIDRLRNRITEALESRDAEETGSVIGTAARCGQSIDRAKEAISNAIQLTRYEEGHEFVSAELRLSADYLGEVTGEVYTDDILDRVFGRFCIGK
jgi:tRNA modification GTPase